MARYPVSLLPDQCGWVRNFLSREALKVFRVFILIRFEVFNFFTQFRNQSTVRFGFNNLGKLGTIITYKTDFFYYKIINSPFALFVDKLVIDVDGTIFANNFSFYQSILPLDLLLDLFYRFSLIIFDFACV